MSYSLFDCTSIDMILIHAESKLNELMNAEKSLIYLVDQDNNELMRFNSNKDVIVKDINVGIIGHVVKTKTTLEVEETYRHHLYNKITDIDTQLASMTMPVFG